MILQGVDTLCQIHGFLIDNVRQRRKLDFKTCHMQKFIYSVIMTITCLRKTNASIHWSHVGFFDICFRIIAYV